MIVLDSLEQFTINNKEHLKAVPASTSSNTMLEKTISVYILLMRTVQCIPLLKHLFSSWRSFILKFHDTLFVQKNLHISDLLVELLRYCNSTHYLLRAESSSLLYLLVKVKTFFFSFPSI